MLQVWDLFTDPKPLFFFFEKQENLLGCLALLTEDDTLNSHSFCDIFLAYSKNTSIPQYQILPQPQLLMTGLVYSLRNRKCAADEGKHKSPNVCADLR